MIYGPPSMEMVFIPYDSLTFGSNYPLDDADDSIAWTFQITKSGTITEVGFNLDSKVGSPPDYNIAVVTLDLVNSGNPTSTPYSDGAVETLSVASISPGWNWITLGTPITATVEDRVALRIWPTGTAPSLTNHIKVENASIHGFQDFETTQRYQFATSWSNSLTIGISAIKLSDGEIFGYPIKSPTYQQLSIGQQAGVRFSLPFSAKSSGAAFHILDPFLFGRNPLSGILYDSADNILRAISWDTYGDEALNYIRWDQLTLQANTDYKIVIQPADSLDFRFPAYIMDAPSSKEVFLGGENWEWIYRSTVLSGFSEDHSDWLPWCAVILDEIIASPTVISGGSGGNYGFVA